MIDQAALDRAVRKHRLMLFLVRKQGIDSWQSRCDIEVMRLNIIAEYHRQRSA